jgi:hypothetical protein
LGIFENLNPDPHKNADVSPKSRTIMSHVDPDPNHKGKLLYSRRVHASTVQDYKFYCLYNPGQKLCVTTAEEHQQQILEV